MEEEVSAFAVYSGQVLLSKNQKRRKKLKEKMLRNNPPKKQKTDEILVSKTPKFKPKQNKNSKTENAKPLQEKMMKKTNRNQNGVKVLSIKLINTKIGSAKKIDKKKIKKSKTLKVEKTVELSHLTNVEQNEMDQIINGANSEHNSIQHNEEPLGKECDALTYLGVMKIEKQSEAENGLQEENSNIPEESVNETKRKKRLNSTSKNVNRKNTKNKSSVKIGKFDVANGSAGSEELLNGDTSYEDPKLNSVGITPKKITKSVSRSPVYKNRKTPELSSDTNYKPTKFKSSKHKLKERMLAEARQIARAKTGSETIGKNSFERLIAPFDVDEFMRKYWEKVAVHIPANDKRFEGLISTPMIDELLRFNIVMFGKHIDVTSYTNGIRETLNPEGRAHPHVIWDYYLNGCSIRLLNPQFFIQRLHMLLATLQEYFGCLVGANAYLTPPNSQGFAPHYDDIEAFVYQVEGRKHWRVYNPRSVQERLPRYSSQNFKEDEVGEPVLDVILSPGDILYFPRGYIHQAKTLPGEHSLHITISTYQKTSWYDLLEKVLPLSLKKASEKDLDFRKGLPIGYLQNAGFAHPKTFLRKELIQGLRTLITRLEKHVDLDSAVDQMGIQFMHDALPPVFTEEELKCSVYNGGLAMKENGTLENNVQLNFNTRIRLLRAYICRLVEEEVQVENDAVERQMRLYYTADNSREYHGEEVQFLLIPPEMVPAAHFLIGAYPGFVAVNDLPCKTDEEKITLACDLWDRGLLMTDIPLDLKEPPNGKPAGTYEQEDSYPSEDDEELNDYEDISSIHDENRLDDNLSD